MGRGVDGAEKGWQGMKAPEGCQFRVITASEISSVVTTDDLDEAFRRKKDYERNYSDSALVMIEKLPKKRGAAAEGPLTIRLTQGQANVLRAVLTAIRDVEGES